MASNGFGYYYSKGLLQTGDLACYMSFDEISGNIVPCVSGDSRNYFSLYGDISNFDSSYGSGYFSGNVAKLENSQLIDLDNFTTIVVFDRLQSGSQILFSTLETGVTYPSGFIVGLTDANKLYISTPDSIGRIRTQSFSMPMANKNGIALSKNGSQFSLMKYNFTEELLYEEDLIFPFDSLHVGSNFYLGGGSGLPTLVNDSLFNGYIDEFSIIKTNTNTFNISNIFEGFYREAPASGYGIINEYNNYAYDGILNNKIIQFESVESGLLNYVQSEIFNITGVGEVKVVTSGNIVGGVSDMSGYLSGYTTLPTGYFVVQSGQLLTGFSSSGLVPSASGITGYDYTAIKPFTSYTGDEIGADVYNTYLLSGLLGPTEWTIEYTDPEYQTIYFSGLVPSSILTPYYEEFNYSYSGPVTGDVSFVHSAVFSNNGNNKVVVVHDLTYSGDFQPTPARILKNVYLDYGNTLVENGSDDNFKKTFIVNGVIFNEPIYKNSTIELVSAEQKEIYSFNKNLNLDLFSGLFFQEGLNNSYLNVYFNGVGQFQTGDLNSGGYSYSGFYLFSNQGWDRNDDGVYDIFRSGGSPYYLEFSSGLSSGDVLSSSPNSYWFINGQKLISGIDYSYSSNQIEILNNNYSEINGMLWSINHTGYLNSETSTENSIHRNIYEKSSQFYINGIRQKINEDYKEISNNEILFGAGNIKEPNLEEIFNTND